MVTNFVSCLRSSVVSHTHTYALISTVLSLKTFVSAAESACSVSLMYSLKNGEKLFL